MKYFIGIDPDTKKSGYAIWNVETESLQGYGELAFFELFTLLQDFRRLRENVTVVISAGWLHKKTNWHNNKQGVNVAARIGANIGQNHQAGKLIIEMCEFLKVDYELVKPTNAKMDAKTFAQITGIKKSNQDVRDSVILIWGKKAVAPF